MWCNFPSRLKDLLFPNEGSMGTQHCLHLAFSCRNLVLPTGPFLLTSSSWCGYTRCAACVTMSKSTETNFKQYPLWIKLGVLKIRRLCPHMVKRVMLSFRNGQRFPGQECCLHPSIACSPQWLLNSPRVYFPSFIPGLNPTLLGLKSFKKATGGK